MVNRRLSLEIHIIFMEGHILLRGTLNRFQSNLVIMNTPSDSERDNHLQITGVIPGVGVKMT